MNSAIYIYDQTRFAHWSAIGSSDVNIALGKPAYMSSWLGSILLASSGNDGSHATIFLTQRGNQAWWAVDFGQERARVKRVRVTNSFREGTFLCFLCVCVRACYYGTLWHDIYYKPGNLAWWAVDLDRR